MKNLFDISIERLNDIAVKSSKVSDKLIERMQRPDCLMSANLRVQMDDGSINHYLAHRVQYNGVLGPYKGGIRFHQNVDISEVKSLALWMTLKCSLMGLPLGGGKGGVEVNPKNLSDAELERLARAYAAAFAPIIGPDRDIPAPDVYTNPTTMAYMAEEYSKVRKTFQPGVITGKPVELGGSLGRGDATGRGGYYCLKELEKLNRISIGDTVAVQGFGNAGQALASLMYNDGYKITAISDSSGSFYKKDGFTVPEVIAAKEKQGSLAKVFSSEKGVDAIKESDLLALDVKVLVPAALENVITKKNASKVKAKYILELANGPVDFEADLILDHEGVVVIPDILANAGGVTVSYFEWVQNRTYDYWSIEKVHTKLQAVMADVFNKALKECDDSGASMREVAYKMALERIEEAAKFYYKK